MICERARKIDIRRWKGCWPVVRLADGRFIEVVSTPCHLGGERFWFICPQCSRRCAILYPAICWTCTGGRYAYELMPPDDRLMTKAFRIRSRLGQTEGGLFGSFPDRPNGMHVTTYFRLVAQGQEIEEQVLLKASARFGIPLDQVW
jgi:hypothetical protein